MHRKATLFRKKAPPGRIIAKNVFIAATMEVMIQPTPHPRVCLTEVTMADKIFHWFTVLTMSPRAMRKMVRKYTMKISDGSVVLPHLHRKAVLSGMKDTAVAGNTAKLQMYNIIRKAKTREEVEQMLGIVMLTR